MTRRSELALDKLIDAYREFVGAGIDPHENAVWRQALSSHDRDILAAIVTAAIGRLLAEPPSH